MDPNLWELYLEGDASDEVMAILRLHDEHKLPPDVTVIAQFGTIATCRLRRGDILRVRALPEIASLKAPDPVVADSFDDGAAEVEIDPSDIRRPEVPERGRGSVVGVVDWGLDFAHPNFRNADGTTRLLALWDQQADDGPTPNRYSYGRIHERREIDFALGSRDPYATLGYDPAAFDPALTGTHGTHVCDIAAGNGTAGPSGIAPEADLVFVHLSARTGGFDSLGDSVTLLEAIDFIRSIAGNRPCVINLSMGNMGGPHDGTTLVEQAIDAAVTGKPGFAICQSCGNYYQRRAHAARRVAAGEVALLRWQTDPGDRTPNELEIWYPSSDRFSIRLLAPDGTASPVIPLGQQSDFELGGKRVARIYHRESDPNNHDHNVHIFLYAEATAGIWTVEITGEHVTDGRFHAWIERDESCGHCQSHFAAEDAAAATTTGTICNGFRTIAVAAYDGRSDDFAVGPFSSVGPTRDGRLKPDLCAPGVRVLAARSRVPGDDTALLTRKSGTSMASPHVTGTVALLFEAARRPLPIDETRHLLIATADAEGIPPELAPRAGAGRLNIEAAVAAARQIAGENVMTTTIESESTKCCSHCGRERTKASDEGQDPSEDVVAQVRAGAVQSPIDTSMSGGMSAATLDDALNGVLPNLAAQPNWAIVGNILTAGYQAMTWTPSAALPTPAVIEVDTTTLCCVVIGGVVYIPSSVSGPVLRWLQMPRVAEFYALAPSDQAAQRKRWIAAVWRARREIAAALPGTTVTKPWLETLSMPALRLLLAQFAEQTLPVRSIDNNKDQRGGVVNGVTNPILLFPLIEPDCYLRVIAGAEGVIESINAWDLGAGVSLGPIQFNAIGGHLFDFVGRLNDLDPALFTQELGAIGWSVAPHSGHFDVTIAGTPAVVLHGDSAHAADNAGFLQSGVLGHGTFSQIDAGLRRRVAARFRNLVVWPHVQELIYQGSSDYLLPGLTKIAEPASGIPPFDPARPDRDLFILKALLLSAFVRYSACLDPLLVALRTWTSVADKLKHILDAVDAMGTKACIARRARLHTRLAGQLGAGSDAWKVIRRLRGDTSPESVLEWEPPSEWDENDETEAPAVLESLRIESESDESHEGEPLIEDFEDWTELTACGESDESIDETALAPDEAFARLSAWSPAEMFDAFYGGGAGARFAPLVEVVAAPGEAMPDLGAGDIVVTRALGEGNVARFSVVTESRETACGVWSEAIESAAGAAVTRQFADSAGRVPANRIVFRMRGAEDDPPTHSTTAPAAPAAGGAAPISCAGGVSLHPDLVAAAAETRRLAGETLPLVNPPCAATRLCPAIHNGFHATGDATHFGGLSTDMIRIAEIAGIWGTDLSTLRRRKSSQQVTMPNPYAPLGPLAAVGIRRNGRRELHIHRGATLVESWVDGARWHNLAVQHALGLAYTLMKRRWFERSIHRQWGTEAAIDWIGFLCRFYKDQTGLTLGIGDISHIVGETMTDHGSHTRGLDVDVYVLEYPSGTPFPEAYWCDGRTTFSLSAMTPPASVGPSAEYSAGAGTPLGTREATIWQRYATVLAFCLGTWNNVEAFVWHGGRQLQTDAVTIATAAAAAWNTYWGPAPAALPASPASKLIGVGHASYGRMPGGWPVHHDHMHIRLTF